VRQHDCVREKQRDGCLQAEPIIITRKEPARYGVGTWFRNLVPRFWKATAIRLRFWGLNRGCFCGQIDHEETIC